MLSWVSDRNLLSYREVTTNFGFSQNGFHYFCNRKSQHLTFSNQYFIILAASIHNSNSMTELRATFCKYFFEHKKGNRRGGNKVAALYWCTAEKMQLFFCDASKAETGGGEIWKNAFNFFPSFLKKGFANGHAIE